MLRRAFGSETKKTRFLWLGSLLLFLAIIGTALFLFGGAPPQHAGCDESLWDHTYHSERLEVFERCATVTGVTVDASHGKNRDGCRHEADGDGHCFLRLDPGQERYVNEKNVANEDGNLVFEPECRYRVTQQDAKAACRNWKQRLRLPPVGSHVKLTGAAVLDRQHGHKEIHPVTTIVVLPESGEFRAESAIGASIRQRDVSHH